MKVSPGLIAKGTAAVGGTSALCAGSYYGHNSLSSKGEDVETTVTPNGESENPNSNTEEQYVNKKSDLDNGRNQGVINMVEQHMLPMPSEIDEPAETSKYDDALINYLSWGNDISFIVTGYNDNKLAWSGTTATLEMKIEVKGTLKNGEPLRSLNGGRDWVWSCKISISRSSDQTSHSLKESENSKIKNFVEKIKGSNGREEKIRFIKKCAIERSGLNKKINSLDKLEERKSPFPMSGYSKDKLFSSDLIHTKKETHGNNLIFSNPKQAEEWFGA